jgi:ATP-dependent protease HslVU (ClpYQ) peptidase subunit
MGRLIVLLVVAEEEPALGLSGDQPQVAVESDVIAVGEGLDLSIFTEFERTTEETDCSKVAFEVVEEEVLQRRRCGSVEKVVVIVQERQSES